MNGAELINAERQRQIEIEGWTPEHDLIEHSGWELVSAAASYLLNGSGLIAHVGQRTSEGPPDVWPWAARFWKPTPDDRIRELVKAGALIAAEIDRLTSDPHP